MRPCDELLLRRARLDELLPRVQPLAEPAPAVAIAAAGFVAGFGIELFGVFWDTVMQEQIPNEALARVSSYDALGSVVFIPLGAAIAGPIAEVAGIPETLIGAGVIVLVATLAVLLVGDVRTWRHRELAVLTPSP